MSFRLSREEEIPTNDFFEALKNAHVEPLEGSEYEKNDTLDKYIYEPINIFINISIFYGIIFLCKMF